MKRWFWILLCVVAGAAQAQLREVRTIEGVTEYALPNGLTVLVAEDASKPTTTAALTYRVGSRHEGAGETGAAHLLEHMLFRATASIPDPKQEMTRRGVRWNGTTSWERTNYFGQFAADDATLRWMIGWLADSMTNAAVRPEELKAEIPVVRNEFERNDNSPGTALSFAMLGTAYHWHAYGRPPIGTMSDVEGMSAERLRAFYKRYYRPDNAVLVLGGKFDRAAALREVERLFGPIARGAGDMFVPPTREPVQQGEREVVVRRTGGVPEARVLYHVMPATQPQFADLLVLANAMGETGGPLEKAIVDSGLALRAGGGPIALPAPSTITFAATLADGPDAEARARAAAQALARLLEAPPTLDDAAIDRARQRLLQGRRALLRDPERLSLALSDAIGLGDWRLLFLTRDWLEAAKPDDVRRIASQWMVASNRTTGLYVGAPDPGARAPLPAPSDVAALLRDYKGRSAAAAVETAPVDPRAIEPALVKSQLAIGGAPGLRMVLLPRPAKDDRVVGQLLLHWGTAQSLNGQETAAGLAGSLLQRSISGPEGADIRNALLAMDAQLRVGASVTGASASFEAPAARVPELLALLGRVLREPTFSDASFARERAADLGALQATRSEPGALASNALSRAATAHYPVGDPRRMQTLDETEQLLKAVTVADVRAFWKRFAGAGVGELAITGPVDVTAVQRAAQSAFGDWRSAEPYERLLVTHKALPANWQQLRVPEKSNAVYLARQPFAMTVEDQDYPALSLAVYMLGGRPGTALWQRVRDREGLSYGVGASLSAGPAQFGDAAAVGINATYAPRNLQRLRDSIRDEIAVRVRDGFTPQQVAQAKEAVLASRAHGLAEPAALNGLLASNLHLGRTLAFYASQTDAIRGLDTAAVNAALRKYVDPAALVEVAAGSFAAP